MPYWRSLGCALVLMACSGNQNSLGAGEECHSASECKAGLVCDFGQTPPVCSDELTQPPPMPIDAAEPIDVAPGTPDAPPPIDAPPGTPDAAPIDAAPPPIDASPPIDAPPPIDAEVIDASMM
jgi:hypothetical protein